MELHQLSGLKKRKRRRRIGRGGKRGTYSGRGLKGQKSRAGHVIRPAQRDLILRLPKRRGFRNKSLNLKPVLFDVSDLEKLEGVINKETLQKAGLLRASDARKRNVKVLAKGTINKPLVISGLKVSKNAKMKIEKAGGKVE